MRAPSVLAGAARVTARDVAPGADMQQHVDALGDGNYHITLYIASLLNLPVSIPLSNGKEVLALLGLADRMAAGRARAQSYLDGVSPRLRTMAAPEIPDCDAAFQAAAAAAKRVPAAPPLAPGVRDALLTALRAFHGAVGRLEEDLAAMRTTFVAFQGGIQADNQVLVDLLAVIEPDGSVASTAQIPPEDRPVVQAAILDAAPNLSQDAGIAVSQCGAMAVSLAQLADAFAAMSGKVALLVGDLQDAEDEAFAGAVDQLSFDTAILDWKQFAAYVAKIGF